MRVVVRKWGNSASVRIPRGVLQAANLRTDDSVDVREEDGRIVIEPIRPRQYDLASLLSRINAKNLHAEIDTGAPLGRESL